MGPVFSRPIMIAIRALMFALINLVLEWFAVEVRPAVTYAVKPRRTYQISYTIDMNVR